jgi:hypothetical protein
MLRRPTAIALSIGLLWLALTVGAKAEQLTLDQALALLEGSLESIRSFDLRIDTKETFLLHWEAAGTNDKGHMVSKSRRLLPGEFPRIKQQSSRQVVEQGKGRFEFLAEKGGQPNIIVVYDGEVERVFKPRESEAIVRSPAGSVVGTGMDYLDSYRNITSRLDMMKCLRERKNVVVKPAEPGSAVVILETRPDLKAAVDLHRYGFRVTLDPAHSFMPAVFETLKDVGNELFVVRRSTVAEWKKLNGGVWVPIKLVTSVFQDDPKSETFRDVNQDKVMTVDTAHSYWNLAIQEDTFVLPFSAGTKVIDFFRNVQFVTGKADPGKNLEDLAAHARNVGAFRTSFKDPPRPFGWLSWLLVGAGCLATCGVVGGTVFYVRRRRREHHP